jgi:copper ion binding protein
MTPLTYRVEGMSCEHCRAAVSSEVGRVAGVRTVAVDLDTKLVRVEGTDVDGEAVVAAIDEAGYDAEPA